VKLIFLGTPNFALPTLKALVPTGHEIAAVITQPDRARGRGMQLAPPPVKTTALDFGLPVLQPENASLPQTLEGIRDLDPDAAVVVAYGQILKREFLDLPRLGCINLHPSLLPRHRGPTPIQSSILAGDRKTGVSTILLDEGMDTGDILLQREVEICDDDTAGALHDKLADVGADLMIETLEFVGAPDSVSRAQDESQATFTRKLGKKDSIIDWSQSAEKIHVLSRAMDPWPGCQTTFRGKSLKVWKMELSKEDGGEDEPGEVLASERGGLIVRAGYGAVRILELQLAGKKRMSAEEFMRGNAVEKGMVFGK